MSHLTPEDILAIEKDYDEANQTRPDYNEKLTLAYAAFDAWQAGGPDVPGELRNYLRYDDRLMIRQVQVGEIPHPNNWLTDGDEFIKMKLPERKPLLIDTRTGGAVLLESSVNQIFAFRGLGKSVVVNALLKPLLTGKDWLHFRSQGGLKVVLVDGELPQSQLQERLREFSGKEYKGRLKLISPELMNPDYFPVLSRPADQERFLRQIEAFEPNVIVFDTLSSIFKFDTNDTDHWTAVNGFLRQLRSDGYCVLLVHHAGKNNTQRGRTDGDDHLDVAIQLDKRDKWTPGDGLQFEWKYEKVRHGAKLIGFEAGYDSNTKSWSILEDDRGEKIEALLAEGKTERQIANALGCHQSTVNRIKARRDKLAKLNDKANGTADKP